MNVTTLISKLQVQSVEPTADVKGAIDEVVSRLKDDETLLSIIVEGIVYEVTTKPVLAVRE